MDAAAAKLYGLDPQTIGHIKMGHDAGVGTMNLDKLKINKLTV